MFDAQIGDWTLHHQSGAMEPHQLQESYVSFMLDDVPEVFLFLLLHIIDGNVVEYTQEDMRERLIRMFDHSKSHSDAFAEIWEGGL